MPSTPPLPSASMERRVLVAELRPECRQQYIEAHKQVWPELLKRYKELGYHKITCHLMGNTLIVVIEAETLEPVLQALKEDPTDLRWQSWMATLRPVGSAFQTAENVFDVTF